MKPYIIIENPTNHRNTIIFTDRIEAITSVTRDLSCIIMSNGNSYNALNSYDSIIAQIARAEGKGDNNE